MSASGASRHHWVYQWWNGTMSVKMRRLVSGWGKGEWFCDNDSQRKNCFDGLDNVFSALLWAVTAYRLVFTGNMCAAGPIGCDKGLSVLVTMETPIHQDGPHYRKRDRGFLWAWVTDTKYNLLTNGIYNVNPSPTPHQYMYEQLSREWEIQGQSLRDICEALAS